MTDTKSQAVVYLHGGGEEVLRGFEGLSSVTHSSTRSLVVGRVSDSLRAFEDLGDGLAAEN
jgi:hypothetical protein